MIWHSQQSPTNFIHLFWTENWEQADQRYISIHLERLVQTYGVQNATANSIKHASSTELAAQGFDGRTINVFTHHTPDSKMNKEYYIFAVNREQDSIASAFVNNRGQKIKFTFSFVLISYSNYMGTNKNNRMIAGISCPFAYQIPILQFTYYPVNVA
ncbi:MAG: hypothetical protein EZS28_004183 [Streblomastix strix]|uniref:Uncharacterized protein n=1 Tax=Streblomastix strix TaxID=222440 RepID=A0A5J4X0L5_9EUKA|nr:MAG: hypothetical protein EZS28_004183 [Streblomastix strix]